ncbi:hypothetical protein GC176_11685 [bacterium]|nr:hypothetical protein [bacterium]
MAKKKSTKKKAATGAVAKKATSRKVTAGKSAAKKSAAKKTAAASSTRPTGKASTKAAAGKKPAASKTASGKSPTAKPSAGAKLGRARITGDAKLDEFFKRDYEARQVFEFLRVHTVKELEEFGPQEIVERLTGPMVRTIDRIRKALALNNRSLKGDERYAVDFLSTIGGTPRTRKAVERREPSERDQ